MIILKSFYQYFICRPNLTRDLIIARLHFELGAQQDLHPQLSDDGLKLARENMSQLISSLGNIFICIYKVRISRSFHLINFCYVLFSKTLLFCFCILIENFFTSYRSYSKIMLFSSLYGPGEIKFLVKNHINDGFEVRCSFCIDTLNELPKIVFFL